MNNEFDEFLKKEGVVPEGERKKILRVIKDWIDSKVAEAVSRKIRAFEKTPAEWFDALNKKIDRMTYGASRIEMAPGVDPDALHKDVYDTDDDGVVDDSEKLAGKNLTEVRNHVPKTHASSHEYDGSDRLAFSRGATKVVAASDASDDVKAAADYVCDGTADDVQIQAAIDALVAGGGGKVVLSEGEFSISSSIKVDSNIHLSGAGLGATILKLADGADVDVIINSDITNGNTNIVLSDFSIDGNGANQSVGQAYNGIELIKVTNAIVRNVKVYDVGKDDTAVGVGIGFSTATSGSIEGCIAENNTHYGINVYKGNDVRIVGCLSQNNGRHGFGVGGDASGDSKRITISNCIAYNNGRNGFWIRNTDYLTLVGSIAFTNQDYMGVYLSNVRYSTVADNVIHDCGQHGIFVEGTSMELVIASNKISTTKQTQTSGDGIALSGVTKSIVSGNSVEDGYAGISIISCSGITVANNHVANMERLGINTWRAQNSTVIGNVVKNCGTAGVSGAQAGIQLNGDATTNNLYNVVVGNRCFDDQATKTQLYGIEEKGTSNYNLIEGNNVVGNKTVGITKVGANTIVRNNQGYVTENSGSATVASGTTSVTVNHGLATTPTRIQVTPRENPTNAVSFWWVDTLTTTQFTIHVNTDPGASGLDFDWRAVVGEGN